MASPAAVDIVEVIARRSDLRAGMRHVALHPDMDPDRKMCILKVTPSVS
jgi:hypothetical protein